MVAVGALVREPLTSIISLPAAKIRSPKDLKGKTVGTAGNRLPERVPADGPARRRGEPEHRQGAQRRLRAQPVAADRSKVDATLGAFWNVEGVELALKRKRPRIIKIQDAGVPTYDELVIVANEDALSRDGDKIRAFISALSRGTRALAADPAKEIDGLLDANPDLDAKLQRASLKVTLPLLLPAKGTAFAVPGPAGVAGVHRLDAREQARDQDPRRGRSVHEPVPAGPGTVT